MNTYQVRIPRLVKMLEWETIYVNANTKDFTLSAMPAKSTLLSLRQFHNQIKGRIDEISQDRPD